MNIYLSEQERTFLVMLLVFENQELRSDINKMIIRNLIKKLNEGDKHNENKRSA